jgi:hypothetical protein
MRDLVVQSLAEDQPAADEMAAIANSLQDSLGTAEGTRFVAVGRRAYLFNPAPFETARVSPGSAAGTVADRFMPSGSSARTYQRLLSEIQMVLHDHEVNLRRDEEGQPRISSLWLWGGGSLPATDQQALPPLYGGRSQLKGYWMHQGASVRDFNGSGLGDVDTRTAGAVVDLTTSAADELVANLRDARRLLFRGKVRKMSVVSQDGITIRLRRRHRWRFWKSGSKLMEEDNADR